MLDWGRRAAVSLGFGGGLLSSRHRDQGSGGESRLFGT